MKKGLRVIFIILCVLIILAGLVLGLAGVKAGWFFVVCGVLLIVWQKSLAKKAKKEAATSSTASEDKSLFLSVAGVTFNNDDGSSRQLILKQIDESSDYSDATAYLERYESEGEDAISVSTVFGKVGDIHSSDVEKVLPILKGGYIARIYPETFEDENDQLIYRADVRITPLS